MRLFRLCRRLDPKKRGRLTAVPCQRRPQQHVNTTICSRGRTSGPALSSGSQGSVDKIRRCRFLRSKANLKETGRFGCLISYKGTLPRPGINVYSRVYTRVSRPKMSPQLLNLSKHLWARAKTGTVPLRAFQTRTTREAEMPHFSWEVHTALKRTNVLAFPGIFASSGVFVLFGKKGNSRSLPKLQNKQ